MNGDVIVDSSQLLGDVTITKAATFASFNNCLLGNIHYNGTNKPLIELLDTIVDGNITFEKPGIIIANEKTIISGLVINGQVIRC